MLDYRQFRNRVRKVSHFSPQRMHHKLHILFGKHVKGEKRYATQPKTVHYNGPLSISKVLSHFFFERVLYKNLLGEAASSDSRSDPSQLLAVVATRRMSTQIPSLLHGDAVKSYLGHLLDHTEVTKHILRVAGQKDVSGVARHGDHGYQPDIEHPLLPRLQHVEGRVKIVHEVVPLDLLVQAV